MTTKKERKKYKVFGATEEIGAKLKKRRSKLKYSLGDLSDLTGFPISTIDDIERGRTADINYYIAYAQATNYPLPSLFDVNITYEPRFQLSEKKQARTFLTDNIKSLFVSHDFFSSPRSVNDTAKKLLEMNIIDKIDSSTSTRISGVLLALVDEEMLDITEKKGRNNLYISKAHNQ